MMIIMLTACEISLACQISFAYVRRKNVSSLSLGIEKKNR